MLWGTMASVTEREKDLMILMALHTVSVNHSDSTQLAKQAVQTKWKRPRTSYLMKGFAVCREACIWHQSLTLLHQSYKENDLMHPIKKRAGLSKHRLHLKHEDLQRVVNFNNYAEDNAIVLPGCYPRHKHFGGKLLPSHVTKAAVWGLYKESMITLEVRVNCCPTSQALSPHKLHHSLDLHFLTTGHTKFAPNWCFGLIKQRFRKTRVNTFSEIACVVKDSTVTGVNIPQLVGLEDGTVLVESYGWQQHLTPYFRPLLQIKQFQKFSKPGL